MSWYRKSQRTRTAFFNPQKLDVTETDRRRVRSVKENRPAFCLILSGLVRVDDWTSSHFFELFTLFEGLSRSEKPVST